MRSITAAVLILAALPAAPPPAVAEPSESVLEISAPKTTLALGERIDLAVKLERRKGKPIDVNIPRLARNSVSLSVTAGGAERIVTRIYGVAKQVDERTFVMEDTSSPIAELKRGKPLSATIPFLALLPGENRVRATYRGLGEGKPPLTSGEIVLTVETAKQGARIGAVVETSEGPLVFTLWPERAYNTVFNFLLLALEQRYDNLTFHRILRGFMIQGGDPKGDGTGGPGWTIPGEFDPALRHEPGVISMARSQPVADSAGSQFFVMHGTKPSLDGQFAAFGRLDEGQQALDLLASADVIARPGTNPPEISKPRDPPVIRTVRLAIR